MSGGRHAEPRDVELILRRDTGEGYARRYPLRGSVRTMRITHVEAYEPPPAARNTICWTAPVAAIKEVPPDIALFDSSKILTEEGR